MRNCYFRAAAPKVEVRGSLIFIVPEDADHEVALEPKIAGKFAAAIGRALKQLSERRSADVVPIKSRG